MQIFKAIVAEHELLAGSFQYLHLELINPPRIQFHAGQYIILLVDPGKRTKRNYSIASPPSMDHAIELLVDVNPQGEGSQYLMNLAPGNEAEFIGPFGNFVINETKTGENSGEELLFVATGSGISPIRSLIVDQLVTKKNQLPIRLWWGMRNQADVFWALDFDELAEEHPNFEWDLVLSKPPAGWPLHSGHVTEHVLDYVRTRAKGQGPKDKGQSNTLSPWPLALGLNFMSFYLCGNQHMIIDVSTKLAELGINTDHIHTEKFF